MATKAQSVTALQISPELERRRRFIKYTVAMVVRVICVILAVSVQGWLMWVFAAGAIFLPYFAVVIANAQGESSTPKNAQMPVAPALKIEAKDFTFSEHQSKND